MTGRFIAFANAFPYPLGDALEQQVSDFVAEGVIYTLESVQIKEQGRNITVVTLGLSKRLSQMFLERIAVEQSGKDIVISQAEYALLGPFTLRNVAYYRQGLIFTAAHNAPLIISGLFVHLEVMFEKLHPAKSERPMQVLHNRPGNLFAKYLVDLLYNSPAPENAWSKPPGSRSSRVRPSLVIRSKRSGRASMSARFFISLLLRSSLTMLDRQM